MKPGADKGSTVVTVCEMNTYERIMTVNNACYVYNK